MVEPGFAPRSSRCPSEYCNHSARETDYLSMIAL